MYELLTQDAFHLSLQKRREYDPTFTSVQVLLSVIYRTNSPTAWNAVMSEVKGNNNSMPTVLYTFLKYESEVPFQNAGEMYGNNSN